MPIFALFVSVGVLFAGAFSVSILNVTIISFVNGSKDQTLILARKRVMGGLEISHACGFYHF